MTRGKIQRYAASKDGNVTKAKDENKITTNTLVDMVIHRTNGPPTQTTLGLNLP